jgi:hypothetical protein
MICSDCYNAIVRVINNPQEETFVVCSLDGKLMGPSLLRCSKFKTIPPPMPVQESKKKRW